MKRIMHRILKIALIIAMVSGILLVTKVDAYVLFLSVLMIGCGKKGPEVSNEMDYREFIEAYTQGYVSRHASLRVVLTHPSEKAKPGQEVKEQLFKFSPKVEGATVWVDNATVEFHPKEALERGKEYQVTFDLGKVVDLGEQKQLSEFVYAVKVKNQIINVEMESLLVTDEGECVGSRRSLQSDRFFSIGQFQRNK